MPGYTKTSWVDNVTAANATRMNNIEAGIYAATIEFNVDSYGAVGDGSTDDKAAIQAALDAAVSADSDSLKIVTGSPDKIYRVNSSSSANGLVWCLSVIADNIIIRNMVIRNTTASASTFFIGGCGKPEGHALWLKYSPWRYAGDTFAGGGAISPASPLVLLPMNNASRGGNSVTLTTAGDASNLAVGDTIIIRSGQVLTNSGNWNAEPDSEYNTVVSATAGTGVVVLERPLAKDYAQEYQSAIGVISTTAVAAVTVPRAVVKATSITQKNVTLEDLRLETTISVEAPIKVRGIVDGLVHKNVQIDCIGMAHDALEYRNGLFENMHCVMRGNHRADLWPVTVAVGCTDVAIKNLTGIATKVTATLHIHEGSARVWASGIRLMSGSSATTSFDISIRARAYGVVIEGWDVSGGGTGSAVIIGSDCGGGGQIELGAVRKPGMTDRSVLVQAQNWTVVPPLDGRGGDIQIEPSVRNPLTAAPIRVLAGWLSDDAQTVTLGTMPAQSIVVSAGVTVYEAFNSSGTDLVSIGHSGDNTAFASAIDVSTVGNKTVAVGTGMGYRDSALTINTYYVNGGGEPTTGKALVWVQIATAPTHVA